MKGIPVRCVFLAAAAALLLGVCAASYADWWQLPLGGALQSQQYRALVKRMRHIDPNDPELDVLFNELVGHFLHDDSLAALHLLTSYSPAAVERIRNDPKLRVQLVYHLLLNDWPDDQWSGVPFRHSCMHGMFAHQLAFLFVDAVCKPIAGATVEVFHGKGPGRKKPLCVLETDPNGLLVIDQKKYRAYFDYYEPSFVLRDRRYGIAPLKCNRSWPRVDVPLVRADSDEVAGSIYGVVVDDANEPMPGIELSCGCVVAATFGQEFFGSLERAGPPISVLTDDDGTFRMHMPVALARKPVFTIPPRSEYQVYFTPPPQPLRVRYWRKLTSGRYTVVKLPRPQYNFHTFAFEDANGPITDPNVLKKLSLGISVPGDGGVSLRYADIKDGATTPNGRYRASAQGISFQPIEITSDSPTEVIFRPWRPKTGTLVYTGRAVYGFTDRPVEGAFVLHGGGFKPNFAAAMLSDRQWRSLERIGTDVSADAPALEPLRKLCDFDQITRTDSHGVFRIAVPMQKRRRLYVLKRGCVPIYYRLYQPADDPNQLIDLGVARLLAAAKVKFELVWDRPGYCSPDMTWNMHPPQTVGWVDDFVRYMYEGDVKVYVPRQRDLKCNRPYTIYTPADVALELWFENMGPKPCVAPVITPVIRAGKGQVVDLGQIDLGKSIPIYVRVVDSAGNPVPGITVRHGRVYKEHTHCFRPEWPLTNAEGLAEFHVPPEYRASFIVTAGTKEQGYLQEHLEYETIGPEDANNVYTLQLSDEMMQSLFGNKTGWRK